MIKYLQEVKFPCGLEIKITIEKGVWHFHTLTSSEDIGGCPLHGKECSRGA